VANTDNTDRLRKVVEDLDLPHKAEKLKKTVEELDLPHKAEKLAAATSQTARETVSKVADLTAQNRDKVDDAVDKLGESINKLTKGRSAEVVTKAKTQLAKGVDKLVDQRPSHEDDGSSTGSGSPGNGSAGSGSAGSDSAGSDPAP
jgi:hypothetical protein